MLTACFLLIDLEKSIMKKSELKKNPKTLKFLYFCFFFIKAIRESVAARLVLTIK